MVNSKSFYHQEKNNYLIKEGFRKSILRFLITETFDF